MILNSLKKIVLASDNKGKIAEFSRLLNPLSIEVIPQGEFGIKPKPELGSSFLENALEKAKYTTKITGLPSLSDDSGIMVHALNGAPGIYSARYAGVEKSDKKNNEKLLLELSDKKKQSERAAQFVCVLVFYYGCGYPLPIVAEGIWKGHIATSIKGADGFGYDPIFIGEGMEKTAAELSEDEKNMVSHRSLAMKDFLSKIKSVQ